MGQYRLSLYMAKAGPKAGFYRCVPLNNDPRRRGAAVKARPVLKLAGSRVVARNHPALTGGTGRRILPKGNTPLPQNRNQKMRPTVGRISGF